MVAVVARRFARLKPSTPAPAPAPDLAPTPNNPKEQRRLRAQQQAKLKPLTDQLKKAESEIAALESQQSNYEKLLVDPEFYKDPKKSQVVLASYDANKAKIEAAYELWSNLSDQIAAAQAAANLA